MNPFARLPREAGARGPFRAVNSLRILPSIGGLLDEVGFHDALLQVESDEHAFFLIDLLRVPCIEVENPSRVNS